MGTPTPPTQESLKTQVYESIVGKLMIKGRKKSVDTLSARIKSLGDEKLAELWPGCDWRNVSRINKMTWNCADYAIANEQNREPKVTKVLPENFIAKKTVVQDPDIEVAKVNDKAKING